MAALAPSFFRSARRFHLGSINVPENLAANAAARDMVICDSVLTVRLMHIIEAATKTAFGNHRFQDNEKLASDVYAMLEAATAWVIECRLSKWGGTF